MHYLNSRVNVYYKSSRYMSCANYLYANVVAKHTDTCRCLCIHWNVKHLVTHFGRSEHGASTREHCTSDRVSIAPPIHVSPCDKLNIVLMYISLFCLLLHDVNSAELYTSVSEIT